MGRVFQSLGVVATLAAPAPASAELRHLDTIAGLRAVSIAYDPLLCGFWIASEARGLRLLAPGGREILTLETDGIVRSLTVEHDGLLLADGWGGFTRIDRQGTLREGTFRLADTLRDVEGIHRDADGTLLVVEDDPARLLRIAPDGTVLQSVDGGRLDPPMTEPQGVTRDPYSGNVLVVDDNEGLNALFELTPNGSVLSVTPLAQWGRDAEGVGLQPETGTLFVGFDGGRALAIFAWEPSRDSIDAPLDRGPDCAFS